MKRACAISLWNWVCLGIAVSSIAVSGANQTKSSYKLTIKGDITQEVLGARNTLTTILDLRYSWLEADTETDRFLRLDAAFMEGKMGTNAMMKSILSTNRFLLAQGAQNMDVTCENAPPAIKARMAALSSPICRLSFDEQGRETRREMQKNAALQPLIDSGFVANVLFFHPPFFPARKQWQHTNEISVGGGAFAQGVLTYQPEPAGSTNIVVKVSGLLTKDRAQLPGNTIASSAIRYRIAGEQVFNTVHQRWESGKMDIAVSMQFMREGKNVGFATGTMTLTLERLPQP